MAMAKVESDTDDWDEERTPSTESQSTESIECQNSISSWTDQDQVDLLAEQFARQHIWGECDPGKLVNTQANFHKTSYKLIAPYNSQIIIGQWFPKSFGIVQF